MVPTVDDSSIRLLAERARDMIFRYRVAPEPGFEYVSPAATCLLGYTPDELIEDPGINRQIVSHEHLITMDELGPEEWGGPHDVEVRRKDGSTIWIEERLTPVFEDERLVAVEGIARDITARRQAEVLLVEREQQLAEAQALAHVGSWEWDVGANRVRWSNEMYRIYGLTPGSVDVTYELYMSRVHVDDRYVAERNIAQAFETGEPFASDYRIVRPNGDVRWLHSRGRVHADNDGQPIKMAGICLDVTDRKQAEEGRNRLETVELRHRQAMDIHDNIVQGLTVAAMALELGDPAKGADAVASTLAVARGIVSSLLASEDEGLDLHPGDLRRAAPALLD
jgi:PAS domain S-box-containing protein